MSIGKSSLLEYDQEMATTRRVLERVPGDKGQWKPHARLFALGHLAQLVSWMPGWITQAVRSTRSDLAAAPRYSFEQTDPLLERFDLNVRESGGALSDVTDADLKVNWSLTMGEKVLFTSTRGEVVRQTINHLIHHRRQLTVYLRLLDVPVPSIYGPTADEGWSG
jgi:uncharacterized damage-inducible protein DinB